MTEGEEKFYTFLDRLFTNESIVYTGLYRNDQLIYLLSRFEGYFPVAGESQEQDIEEHQYRIIDSPIGKIFDIRGMFNDQDGHRYRLHIGFNYEFLTSLEAAAGRNFWVLAGFFTFFFLLVTGLVIYFDRANYRKELELQREKQEKERFKELSLLTAEIAHEIKNPLNSLYLSFHALEKHIAREERNENEDILFYREAIKGEVKRINSIIETYSGLSKEIVPQYRAVDPHQFARQFELFLGEEVKKAGAVLQLQVQIGDEEKTTASSIVKIATDPDLLQQVVLNLVKNSLQAQAQKIELSFIIDSGSQQRASSDTAPLLVPLKVKITDDGQGIPPGIAAGIFKPYVSTKIKGMGLGLHVVKKILKALDGDIELSSSQAGHTVFTLHLPAPATNVPIDGQRNPRAVS